MPKMDAFDSPAESIVSPAKGGKPASSTCKYKVKEDVPGPEPSWPVPVVMFEDLGEPPDAIGAGGGNTPILTPAGKTIN